MAPHGACLMAATPVRPGQMKGQGPAVPEHQSEQAAHLGRGQRDQLACSIAPFAAAGCSGRAAVAWPYPGAYARSQPDHWPTWDGSAMASDDTPHGPRRQHGHGEVENEESAGAARQFNRLQPPGIECTWTTVVSGRLQPRS
jgi:hypothetical protein